MTNRPVLFSGPMIQALLDGRKTQTRRLLKPQPQDWVESVTIDGDTLWCENEDGNGVRQRLPIATGDRLWVREAWRTEGRFDHLSPANIPFPCPAHYEADGPAGEWSPRTTSGRYRYARFMPRLASRLTLTVTDVRVQRLQDISEADAKKEGPHQHPNWPDQYYVSWREAFESLWDSLNAARAPWASNPWVAAYTFTVHRGNLDEVTS